MKSLIVKLENVIDVSVSETAEFIASWAPVAKEIESKVRFIDLNGFAHHELAIEWKLVIGNNFDHRGHIWNCDASMTCQMRTGNVDEKVSIPINSVFLQFFPDSEFIWLDMLGSGKRPSTDLIAQALSYGDIPFNGTSKKYYFRKNWFPRLGRLAHVR